MVLRTLWRARSALLIILTPLVLLPLPILYNNPPGRCAYVLLWMAVYLVSEVVPIAVSTMLPVAILPLLGVASAKRLANSYFKDISILILGMHISAIAVERWDLHKRVALKVLLIVGPSPQRLLVGLMGTCGFLSMWINNASTTAMMTPIAIALMAALEEAKHGHPLANGQDTTAVSVDEPEHQEHYTPQDDRMQSMGLVPVSAQNRVADTHEEEVKLKERVDKVTTPAGLRGGDRDRQTLTKCLLLGIAYSSSIGGTATLTGCPPNLIMKGQLELLFDGEVNINYTSWFVYAFPQAVLCLALCCLCMQIHFLGWRTTFGCCCKRSATESGVVRSFVLEEYRKLGPISFAEKAVLVLFSAIVLLWITKDSELVPGWGTLFVKGFVTDATVVICFTILFFIIPSRRPNYFMTSTGSDSGLSVTGPVPALLDWPTVHKKMPWCLILMVGGGFAAADAFKLSGLSSIVATCFQSLSSLPDWLIVFMLCALTTFFTDINGNIATVNVFLPVVAELAASLRIHPVYLMLPVTVSASFSFMTPVGSAVNIIVYSYGHLKVLDMVKIGLVLNVVCILVTQISINTWGYAYLDLGRYPDWARSNSSLSANDTLL